MSLPTLKSSIDGSQGTTIWNAPGGNIRLAIGQVDVWRIHLLNSSNVVSCGRSWLSRDEIDRADRFHFEQDQRRFIVARGAVREILGMYLNRDPRSLIFSYGARGKPELNRELNELELTFNLAHSRDLALLAVAQRLALGIDLEFVDQEFATDEIAERFFSAHEVSRLRALPVEQRVDAFFSCWTRKEAYLKAIGEGLYVPLDSFDVAFGPGVMAALLHVKASPEEVDRWRMYDIPVMQAQKAALVAEGNQHQIRGWQWEPQV